MAKSTSTSCRVSASLSSDACTSGLLTTYQPASTITSRLATVTAVTHQRIRYSAAGHDTVTKRPTSRQADSPLPVSRPRARATRVDRRPTSTGSGAADRTCDRCVAVRW